MSDTGWVDLTDDILALGLGGTSVTTEFEWATAPGRPDGVVDSVRCRECLTHAVVKGGSGRGVCQCGATSLFVRPPE